ncbi:MAG: glycosyltransferase family 4 protein [Nibricoccus sp.]
MSSNGRRVLFFSPLLAMPGQHGGCVYPHAILTELHRQGFAIDYAWLGAPLFGGRRLMGNPLNASYIARGWVRSCKRIGPFLVPSTVDGWLGQSELLTYNQRIHGGEHLATAAERAYAANLVRRLRPRFVLIDSTPMLNLLDDLSPEERRTLQVAVLTHNLTHRRAELYRAHRQPLDFLPMDSDEEADLLARSDIVIAIQEREADAFRSMVREQEVITVPMPAATEPLPVSEEQTGRCLFVGGYSGHNIESIRWLLSEVWPRVRSALPHAEIAIAGTAGRVVEVPPPGVRVVGPVDDIKAEYAAASVCVVPLPLGTGLKIKLIEAMSFGRPVVTTPAGAEGFADIEEGRIAVVASDAQSFAAEVCRLLSSGSDRVAVAHRQLDWVRNRLSPERALAPYTTLLRQSASARLAPLST